MVKHKIWIACIFFSGITGTVLAQDDLLDVLDDSLPKKEFAYATFKGVRLINGHTVESPASKELVFLIGHRFGRLSEGAYNFFGLDQASIRLGLEYSIYDRLCVGVGRSVYQKTYDAFLKYKLLKQAKGHRSSPVSVSVFSSIALNSLKWTQPERRNYFTSRLAYTHQLLIARKLNASVSVQLMPAMVHKNLVQFSNESNDIYAIGMGGRFKLNKRVSVNAEYYLLLNRTKLPNVNGLKPRDVCSLGLDLETGGHVFQLHITNAQAMFEKGFISETTGDPFKGDIYFGFNISRVFSFGER